MWFILMITDLLVSFNLKCLFQAELQIASMYGLYASYYWLIYENQGFWE